MTRDDPLAPARGLCWGTILGGLCWLALAALAMGAAHG